MKQNYKLVLQYDGSRYHGWQRQGNVDNTIQGKVEAVLSKLFEEEIEVHGSGRTDAGVHALYQVCNFHGTKEVLASQVLEYCNAYLPEDIKVMDVEVVNERFHSRLNAREKTYLYRIDERVKRDVFQRRYTYGIGKELDIDRMRQAAKWLIGEHDFKSFSTGRLKKSTVRRLDEIVMEREHGILWIRYTGSGFLYNMVRIMTGTLIEVGLCKREPEELKEILMAKNRERAGITVPPEGLFLESVGYGDKAGTE